MQDHATSSYTIGNYNIVSDVNYDMPDIITFTARHNINLNDVFIGNTERNGMEHKITCAFAYKNYKLDEIDDNKLLITLNLYDNTILQIDLYRK